MTRATLNMMERIKEMLEEDEMDCKVKSIIMSDFL